MYLKTNARNWRRLKKGDIKAEQQKMDFKEEEQIEMKLEGVRNDKERINGFK